MVVALELPSTAHHCHISVGLHRLSVVCALRHSWKTLVAGQSTEIASALLTMRPSSSAVALAETNAEQHFLDHLARETPRLSALRSRSGKSPASPARVPSLDSLGHVGSTDAPRDRGRASHAAESPSSGAVGGEAPVVALAATLLKQGISNMVDDSFNRCFEETLPDPWNWNIYLYPAWVLGIAIRYLLLFPARLLALLLGNVLFFLSFMTMKLFPCLPAKTRIGAEQW
jgi:hypothetical protein